jgi:hypothetical protein
MHENFDLDTKKLVSDAITAQPPVSVGLFLRKPHISSSMCTQINNRW